MQVVFKPVDLWQKPTQIGVPAERAARHDDRFHAQESRTAGPHRIAYGQNVTPERIAHTTNFADIDQESAIPMGDEPRPAPSFGDFLDIINPLHHIPLVNMLYRHITGDEIGGAAQIIGGALFGGPIGAIGGTASAIVQHQTGDSVTGAVTSAFHAPDNRAPLYAKAQWQEATPVKRYNFNQSV